MTIFLIILAILVAIYIIFANKMINFALVFKNIKRFDPKYENKTDKPLSPWRDKGSDLKKYVDEEDARSRDWAQKTPSEFFTITSYDGLKINVEEFTHPESDIWFICCHGYHSDHTQMHLFARQFYESGYNIVLPDLKSHGDSEGKYIGMGWLDRLDIVKIIEKIVSEHKDSTIILYGISMGAATVMMTAGEKLPENVKAVIEDSGFSSVHDEFACQVKDLFNLPEFFVDLLHPAMKAVFNYLPRKASSVKAMENCELPVLFIHGTDDSFVPVEMVYKVYEAKKDKKELIVCEDTGHVSAKYTMKESYYDRIYSFLKKYNVL